MIQAFVIIRSIHDSGICDHPINKEVSRLASEFKTSKCLRLQSRFGQCKESQGERNGNPGNDTDTLIQSTRSQSQQALIQQRPQKRSVQQHACSHMPPLPQSQSSSAAYDNNMRQYWSHHNSHLPCSTAINNQLQLFTTLTTDVCINSH